MQKDFEKYSVELDQQGFLWIRHKANVVFELEDAQAQEKELLAICEYSPTVFIIDVRVHNWSAPKEVREFHATSKTLAKIRLAEAILVHNLGTRLLANFYNTFHKPINPVKVFNTDREAIAWADKQKQKNTISI